MNDEVVTIGDPLDFVLDRTRIAIDENLQDRFLRGRRIDPCNPKDAVNGAIMPTRQLPPNDSPRSFIELGWALDLPDRRPVAY
jgi:hypothetical protein